MLHGFGTAPVFVLMVQLQRIVGQREHSERKLEGMLLPRTRWEGLCLYGALTGAIPPERNSNRGAGAANGHAEDEDNRKAARKEAKREAKKERKREKESKRERQRDDEPQHSQVSASALAETHDHVRCNSSGRQPSHGRFSWQCMTQQMPLHGRSICAKVSGPPAEYA